MKTSVPLEKEVVKSILNYIKDLQKKGVPIYASKTHGGAFGNAGQPDVFCCYRGKMFVFEVKRPGKENTVTPRQRKMLRNWADAGAVVGIVTSKDQVSEVLKSWTKSE